MIDSKFPNQVQFGGRGGFLFDRSKSVNSSSSRTQTEMKRKNEKGKGREKQKERKERERERERRERYIKREEGERNRILTTTALSNV